MDKKEVPAKEELDERSRMKPGTNSLMHDFSGSESKSPFFSMKVLIIIVVAILLGVGTGFYFSGGTSKAISGDEIKSKSDIQKGQTYGAKNASAFKDSAEGVLKEGGLDGEGEYHLERPGGISQNVYVTSSTVDLSLFIDKKVKVRGQTFEAQKAGWLMDVGQVEVLE